MAPRRSLLAAAFLVVLATAAAKPLCPYYVTQRKDTLFDIATKNGINVEDLVEVLQECINWNDESVLQIGQKLCLPPWYPKCVYVEAAAGNTNCKFYTVHSGDTVSAIADDFGVLAEDILGLNTDTLNETSPIREGMLLRLPPWDLRKCPNPTDQTPCRTYTVEGGDFLDGIATMYKTTIERLLESNPEMSSDTPLQKGQRVKIFPFPAGCGAGVDSQPPTAGVTTCRLYQVKQTDSIDSVAKRFGQTVTDVVTMNPELTDPSLLTPGSKIKVAPWDDSCFDGVLVPGPPLDSKDKRRRLLKSI